MNKEIVVSYWAIGPSYRRELKENLRKNLPEGKWLNLVILTDLPEDFEEFSNNINLLAILDIAKQREKYPWSLDAEPICKPTHDEREYSLCFEELRKENKNFSYSLHRFSLPWIAENGFSKAILLDADVKFIHIDAPSYYEKTFQESSENIFLLPGAVVPASDIYFKNVVKFYSCFSKLIKKEFSDVNPPKKVIPASKEYLQRGDGPIRIFNFQTKNELMKYFNVWNFFVNKLFIDHYHFLSETYQIGPYVVNDETTLAIINRMLRIKIKYPPPGWFQVRHMPYKTRYFALVHGNYQQANTLDEFLEKNNITLEELDKL